MNKLVSRLVRVAVCAASTFAVAAPLAAAVLPEDYEPVGGVRASAGQIIDTGYVPKANSVYHFAFSLNAGSTAWRGVFGNYIDEDHNVTRLIRSNTTATDFLCNNISKAGGGGGTLGGVNSAQGQRVVGWMDSAKCYLTGGQGVERSANVKSSTGLSNETPISLLGAFAAESPGTVEMYSFRIEEKQDGDLPNVVVHDYVPVQCTTSGEVGFYDVVGREFKGWEGATPLEAVDFFRVTVKSVVADDRIVQLPYGGSFADSVEPFVTVDGVRYECKGYSIYVTGADGASKKFASGEECSFDVTLPLQANQAQVSWNWQRADIPAGYERVEYLQSNGPEYLNTGYVTKQTSHFAFKYAMKTGSGLSYVGPFGTYNGEPENCTRIIANSTSTSSLLVNFMNEADMCGMTMLTATDNSMDVVEGEMDVNGVILNGKGAAHHNYKAATPDTAPILLFRSNRDSAASHTVRFWYMEIAENGQLLHAYQPCQASDGEGVMFDAVSGEILHNASTGQFTCGPKMSEGYALTALANGPGGTVAVTLNGTDVNGKSVPIGATVTATATPTAGYEFLGWVSVPTDTPTACAISVCLDTQNLRAEAIFRRQEWSRSVPSGYTRLENIQTTRTQYFDTGFYPCPATRVDASIRASGSFGDNFHAYFFGCAEGIYNFSANLNGHGGVGDTVGIYVDLSYYDGGKVCERTGDIRYGERTKLRVDSTVSVASCGRRTTYQGVATTHYFGEAPMFIAASTNATDGGVTLLSAFDMDIYDWRIWVGDIPARDYVPCVDPNGVAGLYDTLGERFVAPRGGEVVAGEAWKGDVWKPSPTFVHFGGENGMLATTENQAFSSVTANFWVKNAAVRAAGINKWTDYYFGVLLEQGSFGEQDGFIVYVQSNTVAAVEESVSLVFQMRNGAVEHSLSVDWGKECKDNQWHMITVTYDRETTTKRLYVDGVQRAEDTFVAHDPIANRVFHVGSYFNGSYYYPVVADMAELSIWDRALSFREIKGLRYGPLAGTETGLRSYYPFSDGCAIQMNRAARAVDSPRMDGMWDNFTFEDGTVAWPKRVGTMLFVR